MINFTVGPVQSNEEVLQIGAQQVPYFRTEEFSQIMLENEKLIKKFAKAKDDARVVFITGSGTASMEASVTNIFNKQDKLLVINGGSFGQRFVDICRTYEYDYTEITLNLGENISADILGKYENMGYTGLLVNIHETSTGVRYNLEAISEFCQKNNIFLLVDAISSFLADEINMTKYHIGAMITGSQKALACPPGVSLIVLSKEALEKINNNDVKCLYLNLKLALKDGERGQTPFTPAVGTLLQINARLNQIERDGGVEKEIARVAELAKNFRDKIKALPFEFITTDMSNAVTALTSTKCSAYDIFLTLKDEYQIWVCPNGGKLKEKLFRVGHIGYLTNEDYDKLIAALHDMHKRGLC